MSNINLIAFGTFGDPNGFTQTFFSGNPNNTVKTFDIRGSIRLFPKSKLYSIRKESINGLNTISYTVYTYAKEPTSAREGSFIGSAILLTGKKKLDESIIISNLNEFHKTLITKNVENDTITVNHSDKFTVSKPKDFDKISINLIDLTSDLNLVQSNKSLVVFCETSVEKLQNYFKKSIDLLNEYDTIFFTQSEEVAKFVAQKGIFKFIQQVGDKNEFDQEIEKLQQERKQKIKNAIAGFEREKIQLEEERKRILEDLQKQIVQNEQRHNENGKKISESKNNLTNLNNTYQKFSSKFTELINGLNSDKKLEELNNSYKEYKRNFEEEKRKIENVSSIQSLSNSGTMFNPSQGTHPYHRHPGNDDRKGNDENNQTYKYLLFSALLNILLIIGAIVYFTMFYPKEQDITNENNEPIIENSAPVETPVPESQLTPEPNSELSPNDIKNVAKKISKDQSVVDIVKLIFEQNPTDIKKYYENQVDLYTKKIIELNPNCFEEKDGVNIFKQDTIRKIPSFKEDK